MKITSFEEAQIAPCGANCMIHNLMEIKNKGIETFLENENKKWFCSQCGGLISVHRGYCSDCGKIYFKHSGTKRAPIK